MSDLEARLAAKVKAQNTANLHGNELYVKLVPIFTPLIGQKILKADRSLLAKIAQQMPELPSGLSKNPSGRVHIHRSNTEYSLMWEVSVSENYSDSSCLYAKTSVYIGGIQSGVLEKLYPAPTFRTDFTVEEVKQKRETYREAKKASDLAFSALYPFGETDF